MAYAPAMNSEFIVSYFGTLSRETSIDVMREMLGKNMRQNLQMVVQIATNYSDQIGAQSLIDMFEGFKLYEGLFYYLGAIVNNSTVRAFTQSRESLCSCNLLSVSRLSFVNILIFLYCHYVPDAWRFSSGLRLFLRPIDTDWTPPHKKGCIAQTTDADFRLCS